MKTTPKNSANEIPQPPAIFIVMRKLSEKGGETVVKRTHFICLFCRRGTLHVPDEGKKRARGNAPLQRFAGYVNVFQEITPMTPSKILPKQTQLMALNYMTIPYSEFFEGIKYCF